MFTIYILTFFLFLIFLITLIWSIRRTEYIRKAATTWATIMFCFLFSFFKLLRRHWFRKFFFILIHGWFFVICSKGWGLAYCIILHCLVGRWRWISFLNYTEFCFWNWCAWWSLLICRIFFILSSWWYWNIYLFQHLFLRFLSILT